MRAPARQSKYLDRRPHRLRGAAVGMAGAALIGTLALGSAAVGAQEEAEPGKGNAYAQGIKIDPQQGQLSFGITYGQALAGHQNTQAIAEARSLDLGVIGVTLAAEGCDGGDPTLPSEQQPQPLVSRTDADDGGTRSGNELGVDRTVSAATDPLADALTVVAGAGQPGVATIGATTSHATSGVIDGRRVARAVTNVASLGIPGVLEITGMRWEAEYQTEPEEATLTKFSIDGIRVLNLGLVQSALDGLADLGLADLTGGLVNFSDPLANLERINELLTPLGISITAPNTYVESGIAFVDPLRITIAPRNETIGDLITLIQPVRGAITESLIAMDCGNATYVTVADLLVGSVTGAGALKLELGGVTATSGDIDIFEFDFDLPNLPAIPPLPLTPPTSLGSSPLPGSGLVSTPPSSDGDGDEEAAAPKPVASTSPLDGVRGGALLGVGLGVLALLGALAEGDRRKMRKAQRSVPLGAITSNTSDGSAS